MESVLDPATLGGAGVGLGAILVGLLFKLLKFLVSFLDRSNEVAAKGVLALDAAIKYLNEAAEHQVRVEVLLQGIQNSLSNNRPSSRPRMSHA